MFSVNPAAPYFKGCISQTDLDELNIEIIRNKLYKVCACFVIFSQCCCESSPLLGQAYLEDFYQFCQKLGGATAEVMGRILQVCGALLLSRNILVSVFSLSVDLFLSNSLRQTGVHSSSPLTRLGQS